MPTLRSRSVGTPSSTSRSPAAGASASTSTSTASLNNNSKSKPAAENPSFVTACGLDPLTPAGHREHARSSSPSASLKRPQTRAAAASAGTARKTRQSLGKKVLFAEQQQDQQQHEEGDAAAEITVTRRTSTRVRRRGGGQVECIVETEETAAATTISEMADGMTVGDNGKRKAVVALSDSDEEDQDVVPPADVDTSDAEEEAIRRNGSSSTDVAGDGSSSHATQGGQSPRVDRRTRGGSSRRDRDSNEPTNRRAEASKAKFLEVARRRAAHFAHFAGEEVDPASSSAAKVIDGSLGRVADEQNRRAAQLLAQVSADAGRHPDNDHRPDNDRRPGNDRRPDNDDEQEEWPGPFVIARQLVENRDSAAAARHLSTRGAGPDSQQISVEWIPSRQPDFRRTRIPTSLHDMCVEVLCANIEHVTSLEGVPDAAKKLISARLCAHRVMTPTALRLYFLSEPGQVVIPDCTFATEETLTEALAKCSTQRLEVLELGLCGRAMSDQLCASTLAGNSCSLPVLDTLSLNGAYRLTDVGLKTLVNGAPNLSSLILKQCSMISAVGLEAVASSVGKTLKTLSLESCTQLDALMILPPLLTMSSLESLSLSGLCGMSDGIISELAVILGRNLRELYIADCKSLTDAAIGAISLCCGGLRLLDMGHLPLLTDGAIGSLADGCRSLSVLRLDRGKFSDPTLAALVTASGNCLTELSLNSVRQAGNLTLSALSKHSKETLEQLDLSFCRAVSSEALGLLADNCERLREIRLFGCTQITDLFVEGHSNPVLNVIGMPGTVLDVQL